MIIELKTDDGNVYAIGDSVDYLTDEPQLIQAINRYEYFYYITTAENFVYVISKAETESLTYGYINYLSHDGDDYYVGDHGVDYIEATEDELVIIDFDSMKNTQYITPDNDTIIETTMTSKTFP